MLVVTMQAIRDEFHLSYKEISDKSGVPLSTVQKVLGGITIPRTKTLEQREMVFDSFVEQGSPRWMGAVSFEELMLKGNQSGDDNTNLISFIGKKSGGYSVMDYESLPSDIKVELIDGYFYDMASPSKIHQTILIEMLFQLKSQISKNKGKCKVYIAPSDVQLDDDDKTVVQPDLFILCNKDMIKDVKRTHGAPEFVVEVLSDTTRRKDMTLKLNKYMNAGVKEYWIVDPDKHYIIKYFFDKMELANIYTFDDVIPLEIYDGKIEVDFKMISKELEEYI